MTVSEATKLRYDYEAAKMAAQLYPNCEKTQNQLKSLEKKIKNEFNN